MEAPLTPKRGHLMCRRPWWGVAGFLVSVFFAHSAFTGLRDGDFDFAAGWWMVLTWAVWVVFAAGLISETRCWRESLFFMLLLIVLVIGLVFSAWTTARPATIRHAREASLVLWGLAGLVSLTTIRFSPLDE